MPRGVYVEWSKEQDQIILDTVDNAVYNGASFKSSFLRCTEHELMSDISLVSIKKRYYKLKQNENSNNVIEDGQIDLGSMFLEMRRIIKERDEYKSKFEDAQLWKDKFEEVNRKLMKYERESAA